MEVYAKQNVKIETTSLIKVSKADFIDFLKQNNEVKKIIESMGTFDSIDFRENGGSSIFGEPDDFIEIIIDIKTTT